MSLPVYQDQPNREFILIKKRNSPGLKRSYALNSFGFEPNEQYYHCKNHPKTLQVRLIGDNPKCPFCNLTMVSGKVF